MNGMKQGLIIGVVAGLFFGFMLGRYGVQQANQAALSSFGKEGSKWSKMSQLPSSYIRPKNMKGINWKSLFGNKKVLLAKVLNEVPCTCGKSRRSLAYCVQFAKKCKPNMKQVGAIVSQIRDGVDYRRVLSQYTPKTRRPQAAADVPQGTLESTLRVPVRPRANDASFGRKDALVTILEFSDFQCPFCTRGAKTMEQVKKAYGDKVRIVFKHNPLNFHKQAHIASQASLAANAQGKFWQYHDKLFANYRSINKDNLIKWAKELSLDVDKFKKALDSGTYKAQVDADLAYGSRVGVRGTPNFFVNGRHVKGAYPFSHFKQIIDQELAFAKQLLKQGVSRDKLYEKFMSFGKKAAEIARLRKARADRAAANAMKNVKFDGSPSIGPKSAKVTILEFSDFQCPFCTRGAKTMDEVKKAYGDKVRIVFKHNPLSFHKQAHLAAQASMAAHAQGKFWPYHDKLFANYRNINKDNMIKWAKELGLDVDKFTKALDSGKYKQYVDNDMAVGRRLGVQGTPNFFVNGQKVAGAYPFSHFKTIIDGLLSGKAPVIARRPTRRPRAGGTVRKFIPVGNAPTFGPKHALVTIVEFSDFQCPFCTRGANTITRIKKEYGNKVRIAFKHRPLSFHKHAHIAAQASMAAHAQGKFWPYHDKLFANYRNINKGNLVKWAQELGLDVKKFSTELDNGTYKKHVDADDRQAVNSGAGGTPTFFVNGQKVVGAQPFRTFKQMIDSDITLAQSLLRKGTPIAQLYRKIVSTGASAPARRPRNADPSARVARVAVPVGNSASTGAKNAKVTIVEFSDFQCPFCSRGANTMTQVKKAYGDKVRIVFKHNPLSFHRQAHLAAQASEAARAQGKFWQYHDKLFANYRSINKDNMIKWAKELGLDVDKFTKALDNGTYKAQVDADLALGRRVGVRGTPNFFVNGRKVAGAYPFSHFKKLIDEELSGPKRLAKLPTLRVLRPGQQRVGQVRLPAGSGRPMVPVGDSPSLGPKNAKVTIIEFSDFQCPFCTRGAGVVKQIAEAYKNKVRIVFKHRPLSFHKQAHLAAQASMAAHAQGKFWPYHDKLFANSRNINKDNLIKWAKELGLDVKRFTTELNNGTYSNRVDADNSQALKVGARGTPTFFVGTQRVVGAQPFSRFKSIIDSILNGSGSAPRIIRRPTRRPRPRVVIGKGNARRAKTALRVLVKVEDKDASYGPKDALVTIVKFTDFQCPFCSRGANTMKEVKQAYKGKVRIVYKHNPLPFHRQAGIASQASLAANAQGKFWEYHDKIFANYRAINKDNLVKWAKEIGLDVDKFKAALDNGTYKAQVAADLAYGREVGVRGTPNFFVNGRKVAGAYPFSHFAQMINDEIAYAEELIKAGTPRDGVYAKLMEAGKKAADAERIRKQKAAEALKRTLSTLKLDDAPSFGPKDASVTILEFSDFQCPYCSRGAKVVDQIKEAYKGKVRVVFKHLPLSFHKQAHIAAQAAMAAHAQGKFWAYHDKLFANGRSINKDNLVKWAKELGLDADKFKAALDNGTYKQYVDSDLALSRRLGIQGTPNFLINGQKLVGAQPFSRFKDVIDAALAQAAKKKQ